MRKASLQLILLYFIMFQVYMFPANEYEYSFQRDSLKEAEDMVEGKIMDLTEVRFESLILRSPTAIKRWPYTYHEIEDAGFSRF